MIQWLFSAAKVVFSFVFIKKKQFFCVLTFDFLDSAEEIGEGLLMLNLGLRKTEKSAFFSRPTLHRQRRFESFAV